MTFAPADVSRESRDIEACLRAHQNKLYHMAFAAEFRGILWPTRTRFAIGEFTLISHNILLRLPASFTSMTALALILIIPSTHWIHRPFDLCLSLFPWAPFRRTKAA